MVDPLRVDADVRWWRCRLASTIHRCTGVHRCFIFLFMSCVRWWARHAVTIECVQSQTRVRPARAVWSRDVHMPASTCQHTARNIECQRRMKHGVKSANQNSQTDHHYNTAKNHVADRVMGLARSSVRPSVRLSCASS